MAHTAPPLELQDTSFEAERVEWERQRYDLEQRCVQLTVERDLAMEEKTVLLAEVSHLQSLITEKSVLVRNSTNQSLSGEESPGSHEQRSFDEELLMCREALRAERVKNRELKMQVKLRSSERRMEVKGLSDELAGRLNLEEQLVMLQSELALSRERYAQVLSQQTTQRQGPGKPTSWAGLLARGPEKPGPLATQRQTGPHSGRSARHQKATAMREWALQRPPSKHLEHHEVQRSPQQQYREAQQTLWPHQQQQHDMREQHQSPQNYHEASPWPPAQQQLYEAQQFQWPLEQHYCEVQGSQRSPQYCEMSPRSSLQRQFHETCYRPPQHHNAHLPEAHEQRPAFAPQHPEPQVSEALQMNNLSFYSSYQSPRAPRCTGQTHQRVRHAGQRAGLGRKHTPAC